MTEASKRKLLKSCAFFFGYQSRKEKCREEMLEALLDLEHHSQGKVSTEKLMQELVQASLAIQQVLISLNPSGNQIAVLEEQELRYLETLLIQQTMEN